MATERLLPSSRIRSASKACSTMCVCVADSPWQNGHAEKARSALKQQIAMAAAPFEPASHEGQDQLAWFARSPGISTTKQRVFGSMHRVPRSLCSDDMVDVGTMAFGTKSNFQRAHDVNTAALKAHFELDSKLKLQAALSARTRTRRPLERGDWVFVYRNNRMGRRCQEGPGVVIMLGRASTWFVIRGELWKVNAENCVRAIGEEKNGNRGEESFLPELKEKLRRRATCHEFWGLTPRKMSAEERAGDCSTRASTAPSLRHIQRPLRMLTLEGHPHQRPREMNGVGSEGIQGRQLAINLRPQLSKVPDQRDEDANGERLTPRPPDSDVVDERAPQLPHQRRL